MVTAEVKGGGAHPGLQVSGLRELEVICKFTWEEEMGM